MTNQTLTLAECANCSEIFEPNSNESFCYPCQDEASNYFNQMEEDYFLEEHWGL